MKIIRQQKFNVDFFEFSHNGFIYRIGVGNYKNQEPGCEMFYPESGSDYILIIYDNGWYKFETFEFTHNAGIYYIAEKLKCSNEEAKIIHEFIVYLLETEAAKLTLVGEQKIKNPFMIG